MSRRNPLDKTKAISVTIPASLIEAFDYLAATEKGFQTRSGLITKAMQEYVNSSRIIKRVGSRLGNTKL